VASSSERNRFRLSVPPGPRCRQSLTNLSRIGTILISLLAGGAAASAADPLGEITRTIEGRARRATSGLFDPESKQDAYQQVAVLGLVRSRLVTALGRTYGLNALITASNAGFGWRHMIDLVVALQANRVNRNALERLR
jgi:hypothetical protein